ncbi:AMP-binding protein, partial [Nocardia alni]|uniref:AMP-binding protein n=1 Tax=Nocardia alni TaxID=2815723 RepID=UPI001C244C8F
MTRPARQRSRGRRTRVITLPQLLSTAVEADPDAVAVAVADATATLAELTYAELDERSTRLARLLIARGIGPEDLVAVAAPRSLEAVIALWAVAKCGAGFVPVNPGDPSARIAHIVIDGGVSLGLTVAAVREGLPSAVDWLAVDTGEFAVELEGFAADPVTYADRLRPLRAEHPAFVIYTVDTIGAPYGIVITQAGLSGLCDAQRTRYRIDGDARTLAFAPPSDPVAVLELLLAVGGTATMIMAAPTVRGGADLTALLLREDVTHAYLGVDVLETVDPAELDELRVVVCDEQPRPESIARWTAPISAGPFASAQRQVLLGYGATETTILTHIGAGTGDDKPEEPAGRVSSVRTIGTAVHGITEYVLDRRLSPVADGEVGELYITGAQVARGYRRRPARTAGWFVANPFADGSLAGDSRLFRTGDLVRKSGSGNFEYIGSIIEGATGESTQVRSTAAGDADRPPQGDSTADVVKRDSPLLGDAVPKAAPRSVPLPRRARSAAAAHDAPMTREGGSGALTQGVPLPSRARSAA